MRERLITCPENLEPAAVKLAWLGPMHLKSCSRWPEMAGCDQACLSQIKSAPHDCLVRTIVERWYENRPCAFCHRPIDAAWHERPPAVLLPDGTTREWKDIPPQDLPKTFNDAEAVCWACHLVETFRHEHPEWVIERVRLAAPKETIPPSVDVY